MNKKEAKTDLWVSELLKSAGIDAEPQGSSIKEIDEAKSTLLINEDNENENNNEKNLKKLLNMNYKKSYYL